MDLNFFYLLTITFIFLVIILMLVRRSDNAQIVKLAPGPWKLPLIGNLHHLTGGLPHKSLRDLAIKHGPVMHLKLGEVSLVVLTSPKAAEFVMKTHDLVFASRPPLYATTIYNSSSLVFSPYGEYWRQMRKICVMELLSVKRVQSYRFIREEEVNNLVESISSFEGSTFNFSEKIFSFTNTVTARAAFGNNCKEKDEYSKALKKILEVASGFALPDLFPSLKFLHGIGSTERILRESRMTIDKIFDDIINDHKMASMKIVGDKLIRDDLVDVLLKIQERGDLDFPISMENIKAIIFDMFAGGSETSSSTIEWAMSEMMKNPRVMEKAQSELRQVLRGKNEVEETDLDKLHYLKLIVKETLRLHPPVPLLVPREARERSEIDGYEIPSRTKVVINAWAIGRDPKLWTNAESFEPERFHGSSIDFKGANFEYIPFGAGRRMCPGVAFGIANIELPLAQLLYHFDWMLPDETKPEELDMTEMLGATSRRKNDLYLKATPHRSAS